MNVTRRQCKTCKLTGTRTRLPVSERHHPSIEEEGRGTTRSESIAKCLECGYVDESRHFSVLVAFETHAHLCPHCRAGEANLLRNLKDYVLPTAFGNLWSSQYTVVNNEFGHFAVADRSTCTRLASWGSHAHAVDEFRSTERKVRQLASEHETREKTPKTGVCRMGERRCSLRTGTDRRLFIFPVAGGPRSSRSDLG